MRVPQIDLLLGEYHAKHDLRMVPIKVDHLIEIVKNRGFVKELQVEALDYEHRHILGGVKMYGLAYESQSERALIYFNKSLIKELERFVVCKELCHIVLDQGGSKVTSVDQLQSLVEALAAKNINLKPSVSEQLAYACAIELLFPIELRSMHREAYKQGEISAHQLMLRYGIPERFVEVAMYDDYIEMCTNHIRKNRIEI